MLARDTKEIFRIACIADVMICGFGLAKKEKKEKLKECTLAVKGGRGEALSSSSSEGKSKSLPFFKDAGIRQVS